MATATASVWSQDEARSSFPDRQLMLFAADVLSRNAGAEIIFDVKSTRNLFPWIREHGGKPTLWKNRTFAGESQDARTGACWQVK